MANLPTAHASQNFGRKTLDFYAIAGEVLRAAPRAHAGERQLQDIDGAPHTVRLMESGFSLEPGHQASIIRLQPGPARRSRPVAVVNHDNNTWCRTHPGASGLLSRAGVARNANWFLTVGLFILAGLAVFYPYLRAFLMGLSPQTFAAAPDINVFTLAAGAAPQLGAWSFSSVVAPASSLIGQAAPALAGAADMIVFGALSLAAAVLIFSARSWRLLWAPVFVAALGAGALGFGGAAEAVTPALTGLGAALAVFVAGGMVNRLRDSARLERRIALLADHLLRNPPEEMITTPHQEIAAEETPDQETQAQAVEDNGAGDAPESPAAPEETPDQDVRPVAVAAASAASLRGSAGTDEADDAVHDAANDAANDAAAPEAADVTEPAADGAHSPEPAPDEAVAEQAPAAADDPASEKVSDEAREEAGEAQTRERSPASLDEVEEERLRTDPRYASRAIILPPPPPMPAPEDGAENAVETGANEPGENGADGGTRTLRPSAPLPGKEVPVLAAPQLETADSGEPEDGGPERG